MILRIASLFLIAGCSSPTRAPVSGAGAGSGSGDRVVESADVSPGACSTFKAMQPECSPDAGCVWSPDGACRTVANACESVAPVTRDYGREHSPILTPHGRPTFLAGDPCAAVDKTCGYDSRSGLCQPFSVVPTCPATAALARSSEIRCGHPDQPQLECSYPDEGRGVTFFCGLPYRGPMGVDPGPGYNDRPRQWIELADYDDRGCPTSQTSQRARCDAPASLECMTGLAILQCVGGGWKVTRHLPPPP